MGLSILMSLQSSPVYHVHAHRASSLLLLQTYFAIFMKSSLAQLDVFVLFDLLVVIRAYVGFWQHGRAVLPGRHQVRYSSKRIGSSAFTLGNLSLATPHVPELILCVWLCADFHVHVQCRICQSRA